MDNFFKLINHRSYNFFSDFMSDMVESFQHHDAAKGRPVLIIPGFLANDHSTVVLRSALSSSGFTPYKWNHGTNIIASDKLIESVNEDLKKIYETHNTPVTIIGWSMGGFYARALARMSPNMVNSVITLGTPFKQDVDLEEMRAKYSKIGINIDEHQICQQYLDYMEETPTVPFTSLYSKADVIAPYEDCLEVETATSENIEIMTGHFGFVYDPEALSVIIDRCLQEKSAWSKYQT